MAETFDQIIRRQARERSDKPALLFAGETLTYAELDRRASRIANGLIAAGVRPGDRVAYLGKNTAAYFEYLLGTAKARAVMVPINWRLAAPEIDYVLGDSQPRVLVVDEGFEAEAGTLRLTIGDGGFAAWRDAQPDSDPMLASEWEESFLQLYTSGTTGRPKGAMLSHRSLLGLRAAMPPESQPEWYRWTSDDVSLIAMPVAHVSGTGWGIWTLQHGATGVITREFDPHAVLDLLVGHRITKIMMVPTAMQIVVRHPRAKGTDFGFLKYIYYGGSPIPLDLMRECIEVFGCGFAQMYGMTETSGTIVGLPPEDHRSEGSPRMRSVGVPLPGVELRIVDAAGTPLPPGTTGEIATRSVANMVGYFGLPQATAETVDAEGWLRTGDAGYLDAGGYLFLQDRVKDMIISGGENVYPAEVENAIFGHPAVAEVAVVGVRDPKWGEAVKAFVVLRPGMTAEPADIIAFARERIAAYKAPKAVAFVEALPRNAAGKVLRRALREQA